MQKLGLTEIGCNLTVKCDGDTFYVGLNEGDSEDFEMDLETVHKMVEMGLKVLGANAYRAPVPPSGVTDKKEMGYSVWMGTKEDGRNALVIGIEKDLQRPIYLDESAGKEVMKYLATYFNVPQAQTSAGASAGSDPFERLLEG